MPDVEIKFVMTQEEFDAMIPGFLEANKIEMDDDDKPLYTSLGWLRHCVMEQYVKKQVIRGAERLRIKANPIDIALIDSVIKKNDEL